MIDTNPQIALLSRLLNATRLRSEVIAHNVANVNTPGHHTLEVQFEEQLAQAISKGDLSQATRFEPKVQVGGGGNARADGNDVDIDREMGRLSKNEVLLELYAQLLTTQISQYRSAISGQ